MKKTILIFALIVLCACVDENKFDKERWATVEDEVYYPYRENMLLDLTKNCKLKGLTLNSLLKKLGKPDRKEVQSDKLILFYKIIPNRKNDILAIVLKQTLSFEIDKDSIVRNYDVTQLER